MMMMSLAPKVAMGLGKAISNGANATESEWYPLVLRQHEDLCVELKLFKMMSMHMLLFCLKKSLISKTPTLVDRTIHHKMNCRIASLHQYNQGRVTSTQHPLSDASQWCFWVRTLT